MFIYLCECPPIGIFPTGTLERLCASNSPINNTQDREKETRKIAVR